MRPIARLTLFALLLLLTSAAAAAGGAVPAEFTRANEAYARGDYETAIGLYETLAANGAPDALYYNLGNAYFKSGRIGKAILNYERARRLAPRDADVRHNLRYLRALVKEPAPSFFAAAMSRAAGWATVNELAAAGAALLIIGAGFLIVFLLRGGRGWAAGAGGALILLLACAVWLVVAARADGGAARAVVTGGTVEARNGPGADNTTAFTIPEGRIVYLLGESDGWRAVALPHDGATGWVPADAVERV